MPHLAMQKATFYRPKGGLLNAKTRPFATRWAPTPYTACRSCRKKAFAHCRKTAITTLRTYI